MFEYPKLPWRRCDFEQGWKKISYCIKQSARVEYVLLLHGAYYSPYET